MKLVVGQAMKMAAIGLMIGLPIAFALMKLMTSAFFGVVGVDLVALAALTAILALVAFASGYLPARRATKVDPMVALRYE